jgi:hypothetical protein
MGRSFTVFGSYGQVEINEFTERIARIEIRPGGELDNEGLGFFILGLEKTWRSDQREDMTVYFGVGLLGVLKDE